MVLRARVSQRSRLLHLAFQLPLRSLPEPDELQDKRLDLVLKSIEESVVDFHRDLHEADFKRQDSQLDAKEDL